MISRRHLGVECPGYPAVGRRRNQTAATMRRRARPGHHLSRQEVRPIRCPTGDVAALELGQLLVDPLRHLELTLARDPPLVPLRSLARQGLDRYHPGQRSPNPRLAGGQGVADRGRPRHRQARGYRGLHHEGVGQDDPVAVPPGRPPSGPIPGAHFTRHVRATAAMIRWGCPGDEGVT
jgi:hypothetical protein